MIKVLKNRITAWEAWSDGAAHCVESTSQGWHRPGFTLLHSHVVQTLKQWTRIQQLQQLLTLQLYRHPVSFFDLHDLCFYYINPSLASCFQWPNCLYILERFTAVAGSLSWYITAFQSLSLSLSSQWVMKKDSVTQTSFPDINLGSNLNPRNTPSTSILLAVGLGLCNQLLNTIQPCLPSSKPWYSPEKNKPLHSGPKDTQKTFQTWRKPREKNLSTMVDPKNFLRSMRRLRTSFLRDFVELWNLLLHQGDERADLLEIWSFEGPPVEWSRISANWNQSKNCFLTFAIWLYQAIMPSCNYLRYWPQSPPFQIPLQVAENIKTSRFQSPCIRKCPGCACVCMLHENHQHMYMKPTTS